MFRKARDKMEKSPARMCPDCAYPTVLALNSRRSIDCWFCDRQLERPAAKIGNTPLSRALAKFK